LIHDSGEAAIGVDRVRGLRPSPVARRASAFLGATLASMATARETSRPKGPWTAAELERHRRADREQVTRDRARGVEANLREAAALARFANRFAETFRGARGA